MTPILCPESEPKRLLLMFITLDAAEYNVEIMGSQISPPSATGERQ